MKSRGKGCDDDGLVSGRVVHRHHLKWTKLKDEIKKSSFDEVVHVNLMVIILVVMIKTDHHRYLLTGAAVAAYSGEPWASP